MSKIFGSNFQKLQIRSPHAPIRPELGSDWKINMNFFWVIIFTIKSIYILLLYHLHLLNGLNRRKEVCGGCDVESKERWVCVRSLACAHLIRGFAKHSEFRARQTFFAVFSPLCCASRFKFLQETRQAVIINGCKFEADWMEIELAGVEWVRAVFAHTCKMRTTLFRDSQLNFPSFWLKFGKAGEYSFAYRL